MKNFLPIKSMKMFFFIIANSDIFYHFFQYQETMKQYSAVGQAPPLPAATQPPPPLPKEDKPPLPPSGSANTYGYNAAPPVSDNCYNKCLVHGNFDHWLKEKKSY